MDKASKAAISAGSPRRGEKPCEELYRAHRKRVKDICRQYSADPMEAEDLCHEVFIKILRGWEAFRGDSQPLTWMTSIARNTCLSYLKGKQAGVRLLSGWESGPEPEFGADDRCVARLLLARTISTSGRAKGSILLRYFTEGWSHAEIAASLGVTRGAVTKAITRVRRDWEKM